MQTCAHSLRLFIIIPLDSHVELMAGFTLQLLPDPEWFDHHVGIERLWIRRACDAWMTVRTTAVVWQRKLRDTHSQSWNSAVTCLLVRLFVGSLKFENDWRYTLGFQWTTNGKWHTANRMATRSMTSRDLVRSRLWLRYAWGPIYRKWLGIDLQARLQ